MKKLLVLIALLGFVYAFSFLFQSDRSLSERTLKVAIVMPLSHPSLEQIQQGFCETLKQDPCNRYVFTVYNAQGNKTLMRSEIEVVAGKSYDLIFAVGTQAAKMSKEVLTKKHYTTPLVFAAVPNPTQHHLVQSKFIPDNSITGVSEVTDYARQIELLAYLKKDLKNVLLVYDPTQAGLDKDKQLIENELKQRGVDLLTVEIFKTNEIKQKVQPFIQQADVLMILKDNTVVTGLDALVKLCGQHHVVLMASDLDSSDKGAGLAFGVKEFDYGVEAAKKALLILNDSLAPHTIPITPVDEFRLKINAASLADQGLQLDPHMFGLIPEGEKS